MYEAAAIGLSRLRRDEWADQIASGTVQWTRGRKTALSVAVVIVAMVVGFVLGLFVTRLVPGVPMGDGTYEGTVVSFFAFGFTFLVIVGVGGLLGVLYVWRVLE